MWLIYGLVDQRDPEHVRYVGQTGKNPEVRCREHLLRAAKDRRTICDKWLNSLIEPPLVVLLEAVATKEEADQAERDAIRRFRFVGHRLTNGTEGGTGGAIRFGPRTPESVEKGRDSFRRYLAANPRSPLTPEHRANIAKGLRIAIAEGRLTLPKPQPTGPDNPLHGRSQSPEHAAKSRRAAMGKTRTPEQKQHYRKSWTPERRASFAAAVSQSWARRRSMKEEEV